MRKGHCRIERLTPLNQTIHESHPLRFVARHTSSRQDQVESVALPDEAWQPYGAEVNKRHAPAAAEYAEDGVTRGHAHVAPARELQSSCYRKTFNGGDHRFVQKEARRSHRTVT